jgi:hypothetical protein
MASGRLKSRAENTSLLVSISETELTEKSMHAHTVSARLDIIASLPSGDGARHS